jgi:hypothetical protein
MRTILFSIVSLIILLPVQSMALEPVNESHAMFYYQVPFSANKVAEKKHSFGFRMDNTSYQHGEMIRYQDLMKKIAAFDFKFGHEGVEGVYVSGVDYLQRYRLLRADGEDAGDEAETSKDSGSRLGKDVHESLVDLVETVPLGFVIGGIIGVVLLTGAAD